MHFNSETAHAARLATLDYCQRVSNILLDSTAHLFSLYNHTGVRALDLARRGESLADPALFGQLVPELFIGHLRVAGHVNEELIRLVEAQMHSSIRNATRSHSHAP